LAPWYNELCRQAKSEYKAAKRAHGKKHELTKKAYNRFRKACR
jgi:hypothetical protein